MSTLRRSIHAILAALTLLAINPAALIADDVGSDSLKTAPVHRGDLTITVNATGTLEPGRVVEVGTQVAGRVARFGPDPRATTDPDYKGKNIDYGAPVEAGTILAVLDDASYVIAVEQAEAGIVSARAKLDQANAKLELAKLRTKQIEGKPKLADIQHENAEADRKLAQASVAVARAGVTKAEVSLREAQLQLDRTKIVSPIKGVVIDRRVELGQTVVSGITPSLFLIADLTKMQVEASVDETDISKVQKGQSASFTCGAFPSREYAAKVVEVRLNAVKINYVASYTVVLSFDSSDKMLLPYLTVDTHIDTDHRKNVLLVPNAALRWRPEPPWIAAGANHPPTPGRQQVWVRDGKFVRPVDVQVGATDGKTTEITGGELKEGVQVIVAGNLADATSATTNRPYRQALAALGENNLIFSDSGLSMLHAHETAEILTQCNDVRYAAPVVLIRKSIVYQKKNWLPMDAIGTTPDYLAIRGWEQMADGEMFTEQDVRTGRKVCVLGAKVAQELFEKSHRSVKKSKSARNLFGLSACWLSPRAIR